MANNRIVVKRTSTAGRTPNTTASGNLQYIAAGELALNMTDKTFFTSDGTNLIYVGSNVNSLTVSTTITVNGSVGLAGQVLTSGAATNAYWSTPTTGTVTSVASANGVGGGTITGSGTLYIVANNGLVSNTTGVFVLANNGIIANSTGTWAKAANGISVDASGINVQPNTGIISNTTGVFVNQATQFSWTNTQTFSNTITPTSNTVLLGNSTQRWVLSANTGDFSGNVNVTGNVTATLFVGNLSGSYANLTGQVNAATFLSGGTYGTAANGSYVNTTILATGNSTVNAVINSSAFALNGVVAGGFYKGNNSNTINLAAAGNIFRVNSNTLTASVTFAAGENGTATGPIAIQSGISLIISTGARVSIV